MKLREITDQIPVFTRVVRENWLRRKQEWAEKFIGERLPWFVHVERDLTLLLGHLGAEKLIASYRNSLRNVPEIQKAIFEIHGAALLGSIANKMDIHVPREPGSNKNFDVWAEVEGHSINAESKTRKDEFPFNLLPESDESEIPSYAGVRETMDPHDARDLAIEVVRPVNGLGHIANPESTVIRQLLQEALGQLPSSKIQ